MYEPIVSLKNVSFAYGDKEILSNIDLQIPSGSFVGLLGPNGGGKTTLIRIILGRLQPTKGKVNILGKPVSSFSEWHRIGFVSQKANTFNKGFPATVFEVVSMGLTAKIGYFRLFKRIHREKVTHAIEQVGLKAYAYQNVGELSGGQQQRVFIARALVSDPDILILDEPTVGVDFQHVEKFYELLHNLNDQQNVTIIFVTHDTHAITTYTTHIACLQKSLQFYGNTSDYLALTKEELAHIYG